MICYYMLIINKLSEYMQFYLCTCDVRLDIQF